LARFYFDHNVSGETAVYLRLLGHDVVTARTAHRERAPDYQQLLLATEQDRILVTHNGGDFILLHGAWRLWSAAWNVTSQHSGIVLIPPGISTLPEWRPSPAAQELSRLVASGTSLANELYAWRRATGWEKLS
jgi:hypothetical protein